MTEFKFNPRVEIFRQFKEGEDGIELEADENAEEKFDEFWEVVVDETEFEGDIGVGEPGSEVDWK